MRIKRMWWWAVLAYGAMIGFAAAEPVRTLFTMENKMPEAGQLELGLGGGATTYEAEDWREEDATHYELAPALRYGLTDRLALRTKIPFVGYSIGNGDEQGLGDIELGADFVFFEDIFEYAWILPHATLILPTGDEKKNLGVGEEQTRVGVSVGTTVNDVLHFAVDASYTINGALPEEFSDDREDLLAGALSIIWDLDQRSSLLGEVQVSDTTADDDSGTHTRGHLGMAYKVNKRLAVMAYGGASSSDDEEVYGMGRIVYSF